MENPGGNGGARSCNLFGKESVNYPVNFDLKAIIDAGIEMDISKKSMEALFDKFKVPFHDWRTKSSSGGKYISYTVSVEIDSKKTLDDLYNDLKKLPGMKFAL